MSYSTLEKVEMVIWALSGNSYQQVVDMYSVKYADKQIPTVQVVKRAVDNFKNTGCVNTEHKNITKNRPRQAELGNQAEIIAHVKINPNISVKQLAKDAGTSTYCAYKILRANKFKSYKYSHHQELRGDDAFRRMSFCEEMLEKCSDPVFLSNICFSDEKTFSINGGPNRQNYRFWSTANPHLFATTHTQYPQSLNVWCGIYNNNIVGPYFIDGTLTGQKYLDLLENKVFPDISEMCGANQITFQHDGAPAHCTKEVTDYLNAVLPDSWIGRNGPVKWPARSPDLAPNDFFYGDTFCQKCIPLKLF